MGIKIDYNYIFIYHYLILLFAITCCRLSGNSSVHFEQNSTGFDVQMFQRTLESGFIWEAFTRQSVSAAIEKGNNQLLQCLVNVAVG